MALTNSAGIPGMDTPVLSTENAFLWGPDTWYLLRGCVIDSACTDAGSTPTTDLRPGLVMGRITSTDKVTAYAGNATDGSGVAEGVLFEGVRMLNPLSGVAAVQFGNIVVAGPAKSSKLFGLDQQARAQLANRFVFDDDLHGNKFPYKQVVAKTADYAVVAADHDTLFTNQGAGGAVNFTLPAIAKGLRFHFYVEAAQSVTLTSVVTDTLVVFNDAAADTVAFSTASKKIGGSVEVVANADATKWLVIPHVFSTAADGSGDNTLTIAT